MSDFAWSVVVSATDPSSQPVFAIVATCVGADYVWPEGGPRSSLLNAERVQRIAQFMVDGGEMRALPNTAEDWIRAAATNLGYNVAAELVAVDSLDAAIKSARRALDRRDPTTGSRHQEGL